ncbi:TetR/AcrR family transcriptional regulator [Streptomyces sp. NPDC002172]
MPKVSQEYLDARRAEILSAARRCFVRNGFHATTVQDVLTETGLSTGAVYRYFSGKQDMIVAIAEENLGEVVAEVRKLANQRPTVGIGEALTDLFEVIKAKHAENGFAALTLLVWSESLYIPALTERINATIAEACSEIVKIVREHQNAGTLPLGASADELAQLIATIVPGFILQLTVLGPSGVAGLSDAARALWPEGGTHATTPHTAGQLGD